MCDILGNHEWGFVIYRVCDFLLHRVPSLPYCHVTVERIHEITGFEDTNLCMPIVCRFLSGLHSNDLPTNI